MTDPKFQRHGTTPVAGAAPGARPTAPAAGTPRTATQAAMPARQQTAPSGPGAGGPNAPTKPGSGRVVHDERGNAIWEWVTTTTKNAILSATSLLKKLDSSGLSLDETPDDDKAAMLPKHRPGGGFNPYEQAANKTRGKK